MFMFYLNIGEDKGSVHWSFFSGNTERFPRGSGVRAYRAGGKVVIEVSPTVLGGKTAAITGEIVERLVVEEADAQQAATELLNRLNTESPAVNYLEWMEAHRLEREAKAHEEQKKQYDAWLAELE